MVSEVVMKNLMMKLCSVEKCQYFYERGSAHELTHSKIFQNLAA